MVTFHAYLIFCMKKLYFFLIPSLFCRVAYAQTQQDTLAKIEHVFARVAAQNPGCQLTVARNGNVLFSKAWGMADLEHGIPLSPKSLIEAGSVSKQFTAAAVLLLEQQGRLSLEDDIRKHVPEMPDYGRPIRLRHLLHHTSGIRDWGSVAALTGWPRSTKFYSHKEALDIIVHQKSLNNQPGDEFIYSNSNYNLLAIIVQRVSGLSLADYTRKHIFEPAGMANTQWRDNPNRVVPNRAMAYRKVGEGYETNMPNEFVYGNGGLLTTTDDLVKWQEFYRRGKMGTAPLLAKQTQVERLTRGGANEYGAGLFIEKASGQDVITHSGATAGYRANLEIFPKSGLSIALLSNTGQYNIGDMATSLRNIFITPPAPEAPAITGIKLPEGKLNAYAGWYRNPRDGAGLQLAVKDGALLYANDNKLKLLPQSETRFALNRNVVEMDGMKGLRYIVPSGDTVSYAKVAPALASDNLAAFVGRYFSEETSSFITVSQRNGKLMLSLKPEDNNELTPTYKDAFTIASAGVDLYFTKQKKGRMSMKISIPRARNVEFVKM